MHRKQDGRGDRVVVLGWAQSGLLGLPLDQAKCPRGAQFEAKPDLELAKTGPARDRYQHGRPQNREAKELPAATSIYPFYVPETTIAMSEKTRLKCTVYVGGLDQAVTVQTLAEAFVPFGEVVDITLPKPDLPNSNDVHRGFGYVEYDLPEDAKEAIDNMDGSELYGRTIKVAPAKPQKDANEGLGSKTAIWEQVCLCA